MKIVNEQGTFDPTSLESKESSKIEVEHSKVVPESQEVKDIIQTNPEKNLKPYEFDYNQESGSGNRLVIMLPGYGRNTAEDDEMLRAIREKQNSDLRFDTVTFGYEGRPYSRELIIAQLKELIEQKKEQEGDCEVFIMATSYGCTSAIELAHALEDMDGVDVRGMHLLTPFLDEHSSAYLAKFTGDPTKKKRLIGMFAAVAENDLPIEERELLLTGIIDSIPINNETERTVKTIHVPRVTLAVTDNDKLIVTGEVDNYANNYIVTNKKHTLQRLPKLANNMGHSLNASEWVSMAEASDGVLPLLQESFNPYTRFIDSLIKTGYEGGSNADYDSFIESLNESNLTFEQMQSKLLEYAQKHKSEIEKAA